MHGKRILLLFFLFFACAAGTVRAQLAATQLAVPPAQLRYEAGEPIVMRDGSGAGIFTIINPAKYSIPLALRVGPFRDDTSQVMLPTPRAVFATETGAPPPLRVDPGLPIRIQVNVSGLIGAALASAELFNGEAELGRLHLVEANAPLNVSITGNGGPDQRLVLADGNDTVLTLKNNDPIAYPLDWAMQIGGKTLQSGELQLGPHGSSQIELTPTDDLYSLTDNLRPATKTGILTLSLHGPPEVARELLPQRTLQVNLLMRKLSPTWTSFWSHLLVALVLLLGGLLSVIANSVLPNLLRKISLRRQIVGLAERIGGVSERVDSYVRGLLRLERKRIDLLSQRVWVFSLSSTETLDEVTAAIERLSKRLKVTERLDDLRRKLEDASVTVPPSVTDDIDTKLRMAATQLHSFALADEEVTAANSYLEKAGAALEEVGNRDALAQVIAANFKDLRVRQKLFPYSYYNDLKVALPGLFEMLNQPFDDPANITRPMMFAIDYGISALQLAFDYAVMRVSTPAAEGDGSGLERSARERMLAHQKELVSLLGSLSWSSLRELRALVQEMRENIYERDVLEEVATPGQAEIVLDPQTVRRYAPVLFAIKFKDPRFNDAAATQQLICKWDFPGHLIEQGWRIFHFFQGNETKGEDEHDLTVSVRVESQKVVDKTAPIEGKTTATPVRSVLSKRLEVEPPERPSYSRAFAEGVRFLIAFGVALAGLLSGALQQLEKLDFVPAMIGVLALGFGADTIKNLLTQTSNKAAG